MKMVEEKFWKLKWKNKFGDNIELTHLYEKEIYKLGEALINENKHIDVCLH